MTKRQAKREACGVVSRLIESYLDVGQPGEDCRSPGVHDWAEKDEPVLTRAFEELQREMERRA